MLLITAARHGKIPKGVLSSAYPALEWISSAQRKKAPHPRSNPELHSVRQSTPNATIKAYPLTNPTATGSVSGLAAYFLSIPELQGQLQVTGQTAQKVKDYILEKAYPRIDGEVKVLYNTENSDQK